MPVLAETRGLVADQVITERQAGEIEMRARQLMVQLGVNVILCAGVIAATFGLIAYLADPLAVALTGFGLLGGGLLILHRSPDLYRMFGNAAALIGAGMLIGGSYVELTTNYEDIAGWASMLLGVPIAMLAGRSLVQGGLTARLVAGSIMVMGTALHLAGLAFLLDVADVTGPLIAVGFFYATVVIASMGWLTDVRTLTALAIAPFAQMLDTSTAYFHAAYVFYSPESTLSILQMTVLIAAVMFAANRVAPRTGRHLRILALMGFIVANLCALVGSLWGDVVGLYVWGPRATDSSAYADWQAYRDAITAFEASALTISEHVYSVLWAIALVGMILWTAQRGQRGLFNTAMTFLAIHGYTQAFETFYEEPLAYVIGGGLAIPLAWGIWRLNQRWLAA